MKNVLNINDLSTRDINIILYRAKKYILFKPNKVLEDKIIGMLFFEPSTRTHYSFESAVLKLGGNTLNYNDNTSSSKKGETLEDTIKTMSLYCDALIVRHPKDKFYLGLNKNINVPIVNAGDGSSEHPSQALLDVFTIREYTKESDNFHIAFVGDLKNGRTIHSTLKLLDKLYNNITFHLISVNNLQLDELFLESIKNKYEIHNDIKKIIAKIDVLYLTRIQNEREPGKDFKPIVVTNKIIEKSKDSLIILHPFPRNNELPKELDNNPKSKYFEQMQNGVFVRMAILDYIFLEN